MTSFCVQRSQIRLTTVIFKNRIKGFYQLLFRFLTGGPGPQGELDPSLYGVCSRKKFYPALEFLPSNDNRLQKRSVKSILINTKLHYTKQPDLT